MKRLIVNADDFGLTAKVNEAILEGHCRGVISSTSLLANGEAFEAAVALSHQAPQLGVGVHLNLTQGKSVVQSSVIPSLVDRQGLFARKPGSLWRAIIVGQVRMADIENEFRAQVEKVVAAGIVPTHLDSHKHVHALPVLGKLVIRLARQYGIPGIRCVLERRPHVGYLLRRYPGAGLVVLRQLVSSCALSLVSQLWTGELRTSGVNCASRFYGLAATGFLKEDLVADIFSHLPDGTSELMCHPGRVDDALRRTGTRLLDQREAEYQALMDPKIKHLVQDLGIQLVSYREIVSSKTVTTHPEKSSRLKEAERIT